MTKYTFFWKRLSFFVFIADIWFIRENVFRYNIFQFSYFMFFAKRIILQTNLSFANTLPLTTKFFMQFSCLKNLQVNLISGWCQRIAEINLILCYAQVDTVEMQVNLLRSVSNIRFIIFMHRGERLESIFCLVVFMIY